MIEKDKNFEEYLQKGQRINLPLRRWKRENLWERLREEKEGNLLSEESEGRIEEEAMEKDCTERVMWWWFFFFF